MSVFEEFQKEADREAEEIMLLLAHQASFCGLSLSEYLTKREKIQKEIKEQEDDKH